MSHPGACSTGSFEFSTRPRHTSGPVDVPIGESEPLRREIMKPTKKNAKAKTLPDLEVKAPKDETGEVVKGGAVLAEYNLLPTIVAVCISAMEPVVKK